MNEGKLILKPKPPKGEDGYRIFSIRIKVQTVETLEKICTETGYSRNELIGIFIDFALEHYSSGSELYDSYL